MRQKYLGITKKWIIILPLLWWSFDVRAQVPEEVASMPEQWQLTLDVIKSKAQNLLIKNNGLQTEYRQMIVQAQKLERSISIQQSKNEQMDRFLKERHGRTDQQVRIEELTQVIKTKRQQARSSEEEVQELAKKKSDLDHKIQGLKYTISDIELHQQAERQKVPVPPHAVLPQGDDQLSQWRKDLEDENRQEVLLENQLAALKTGERSQNLNVDVIEGQNRELETHLDTLRLKKLQHLKMASEENLAQANKRRYDELKERKEQLEVNINAYEYRLSELRDSSLMALSWPLKKKQMVHEMVQTDARNNQMRDKIKVLKEDIDILKDQVARLERRVDFAQNKVAQP